MSMALGTGLAVSNDERIALDRSAARRMTRGQEGEDPEEAEADEVEGRRKGQVARRDRRGPLDREEAFLSAARDVEKVTRTTEARIRRVT